LMSEGIHFRVIRSARIWQNNTDVREDIEKMTARGPPAPQGIKKENFVGNTNLSQEIK